MILLVLALAAQTDTTCIRNGIVTNCTTGSADPTQIFRDQQAQALRAQAQLNAQVASASDRQESEVGALIAQKDCAGAARLARFYADRRLIKKTEQVCGTSPSVPKK